MQWQRLARPKPSPFELGPELQHFVVRSLTVSSFIISFVMFHHVSSLIDWSNQGNMIKNVTSTCCINIHSACPIAAPARLPIARPEELTVLSQIFSFQLDPSMSRSVTNVMFQYHRDSCGPLHSVTYMFQIRLRISLDTEYYGIPIAQNISAAHRTDSSELRTVN